MNKLIVTTALALLGTLTNPAMVSAKSNGLTITELFGGPFLIITCRFENHSEQTIPVVMEFCVAPKDNSAPAICDDVSPSLSGMFPPGQYEPSIVVKADPTTHSQTCRVSYTGNAGAITGTACGTIDLEGTKGCVPMHE